MPDAWLWERGENPTGKGGGVGRGTEACEGRRRMHATSASAGRSAHADVHDEPAVSFSNILSFSWTSVAAVES